MGIQIKLNIHWQHIMVQQVEILQKMEKLKLKYLWKEVLTKLQHMIKVYVSYINSKYYHLITYHPYFSFFIFLVFLTLYPVFSYLFLYGSFLFTLPFVIYSIPYYYIIIICMYNC